MAKPDTNDPSTTAGNGGKTGARTALPERAYAIRPKVVRGEKQPKNDKLQQLVSYLMSICEENFTGYIKINYSQGSIGRVERFEEILRK